MRTPFVVGLVAEGKTDLPVIECLVAASFEASGRGPVEVRNLHPHYDATSGTWEDGGWYTVLAWCLQFGPTARVSEFLRPVFAGDRACDALLVHLDGDMAHKLATDLGLPPLGPSPPPDERGSVIRRVLDVWLWPKPEPEHRPLGELHVPLPAVQATETWIVAGARPDLMDPESVEPTQALIAISPGLEHQKSPGHLRKSLKRWRRLSRRYVAGNEASIIARCPHLAAALDELTALAP